MMARNDEKKYYVTQLFLYMFDIRTIEKRISRESCKTILESDTEKMYLQAFAFCDEIRPLFDKKKFHEISKFIKDDDYFDIVDFIYNIFFEKRSKK